MTRAIERRVPSVAGRRPQTTAGAAPFLVGVDGRFLSDRYPGVGRYLWNLLDALPRAAGEERFVVLTGARAGGSRFSLAPLAAAGVTLRPAELRLRSWRELVAGAGALPPGLAVFHSPFHLGLPLAAGRLSCPLVVTVHDVAATSREALPGPLVRRLSRWALGRAVRRAAGVVVPSEGVRRALAAFAPAAVGVTVTPEAPDPSLRRATPETIAALRHRLRLPRRFVLYLGSNKPHKNLPRLVAAWHRLPAAERAGWELVLAGFRDRRYPHAEQLARRLDLDDVRFLGAVAEADLAALYSAASLFVFPSLHEGFGLPVVEAMACGLPVACADAASLPEVAGSAAAFFDPRDVASIAATLARLLREGDERRHRAQAGRRRAAELSWEATARRTLEAYHEAVGAALAGSPGG